MREVQITKDLVVRLLQVIEPRFDIEKVNKVVLNVGSGLGISEAVLRQWFASLTKGSKLENVAVEIVATEGQEISGKLVVSTAERVGVFLCECGPNLKEALDFPALIEAARLLDNVVLVKAFSLLCSGDGQQGLAEDIKTNQLTRVVIAGCSPREHEHTFKKVLKQAGINPYLLRIANIREQCAWIMSDKQQATDLAALMIKAAVRRVLVQEPLEEKEIDICPDVLVIGAGITGMSAALALAQKQRKVYLVEQLPCIGGKTVRYEESFPNMECAPCMLEPKMDAVLHNERIETLTCSDVQEVLGYFGNFEVKVKKRARGVDEPACIGCGACVEACPVELDNEFNENLSKRKAIYLPYPGVLPNVPVIDKAHCLRFQGKECSLCEAACAFGAVNYGQDDEVRELKVGAVIAATGFDLFDAAPLGNLGLGKIPDVYTSLAFERMMSASGPTEGKIVRRDGSVPRTIALVHCVGSRTAEHRDYCSGICCAYLAKFARLIHHKLPETQVLSIYSDLCFPGKKMQPFFEQLIRETNTHYLRVRNPNALQIGQTDGVLEIAGVDVEEQANCAGGTLRREKRLNVRADMVVLAPAMEGSRQAEPLSRLLDVPVDGARFFIEEHVKLSSFATARDGILVAGCAQSPQDVAGSVAQGVAAAGMVLSRLVPGEKIQLEPAVSVVDEKRCSGCKTCVDLCPYHAISYDGEKHVSVISGVLCRGCGICVAACPSGAIVGQHFRDEQICAEIQALLK
ncbi:MAG: CoB--CoM heterodisulfide reductase iron-sulfur subunit A family protein [Candidatus Omnitrophica bacterium]|nr:CoB--CoM heterodisulfide reductase iron-sulfur subunit A family protein [Candidatus Omnitrophota bacterium]